MRLEIKIYLYITHGEGDGKRVETDHLTNGIREKDWIERFDLIEGCSDPSSNEVDQKRLGLHLQGQRERERGGRCSKTGEKKISVMVVVRFC